MSDERQLEALKEEITEFAKKYELELIDLVPYYDRSEKPFIDYTLNDGNWPAVNLIIGARRACLTVYTGPYVDRATTLKLTLEKIYGKEIELCMDSQALGWKLKNPANAGEVLSLLPYVDESLKKVFKD